MKKVVKYLSFCLLAIISCCLFSACGSNIKLKINFDSNGGTNCSAIYYEVGKNFNMPSDPTKENYIFDGWYEDNGTWEKPFTTNTILNYPLNKDMEITIYAKWLNKAHILFESNGGSECESIYFDNKNTTLPTPTKTGFKFAGWYLDNETFVNEFSNNGELNTDENNSITLYAKWDMLHLITFNANGGENVTKIVETESDIYIPTRDGYTFQGWYYDNGNWNNEFTIDSMNAYSTREITVYAKWKLNQYLKFNSNGGSDCEQMLIEDVTEQNLPTPKKPLYLFVGWYTNSELETPFHVSEMLFTEYQTEMTVFAKWEEKKIQNVTFNGTPKIEYLYGEEFDANGMYANVEYYYYESETVYITSSMISGFDTNRISLDKDVSVLRGTIYINIGSFSTNFEYSVSPKYKSIAIKSGTIQTEYLIGENSTTITQECNGSNYYYNRSSIVSAFRCTIIATNFDNSTEEVDVVYFTDEQRELNTICNHSYHNTTIIIDSSNYNYYFTHLDYFVDLTHQSIYNQTKAVSKSTYLYEHDSLNSCTTNAYCNVSTNNVGTFTATLYYGLCSVDFDYTVNYAENEVESFEQNTCEYIKELDNDKSLLNQEITIILKNGRKFKWKIDDQNYIVTDFDFTTSGEKEALVNFPYENNTSSKHLQIKYNVISLEEIEYIDSKLTFYQCSYQQSLTRNDLSGKWAYYYDGEELKSIRIYIPYSFNIDNAYLDLSNAGENFATINIAGVDVKIKYFINEITHIYYEQYSDDISSYIIQNSSVSLRDLSLFAVYENGKRADINNQIWYIGDNNQPVEDTQNSTEETPTQYFTYEILEDIDTSTVGTHTARILMCGTEFEIEYIVLYTEYDNNNNNGSNNGPIAA